MRAAPLEGRSRRGAALALTLLLATGFGHAAAWTEFEKAIGQIALAEMKLRHGLVEDPLLQGWVDAVAAPVAAQSTRHLLFSFHILGSYEDNAFSLPGGIICVTRGLLTHVTSDEELAGVLAHEVAHAEDHDFQRQLQQQCLYLAGQSLLRRHVAEEWVYVTQLLQLVDGLRRQRQHELQADLKGTEMAYAARFDPEGVASFLAQLAPQRGLEADWFATHPQPARRLAAVRGRLASLQRTDSVGLMAVGDSLRDRLHFTRAAALYEAAARAAPAAAEPAQRLADMRRRQGLDGDAPERPLALSDDRRAQVAPTLDEMRRREQDLYAAEKRLRRQLARFMDDRDIARALELSQVIAPESGAVAYLTTLARAYYALNTGWTEAMRMREIASRSGAIRAGWERTAADLQKTYKVSQGAAANDEELVMSAGQFGQAVPALVATTTEVNRAAQVAGELSTATRLVALAFLGLVASGANQPLGRLNYTRFLLLQGDVTLAERQLERVARTGQAVHTAIIRQHLGALAGQMSVLHAVARPALRDLDVRLIARRLSEAVAPSSAQLLGDAVLERTVTPETPLARLQALDAVLRMCYLDMRAERGG